MPELYVQPEWRSKLVGQKVKGRHPCLKVSQLVDNIGYIFLKRFKTFIKTSVFGKLEVFLQPR